jgi:hypothetical protein
MERPCPIEILFEVRQRYNPPHIVRQIADEDFVDQVHGPEYKMDDQQEKGMIVVPTDHYGINSKNGINNAAVSLVHIGGI